MANMMEDVLNKEAEMHFACGTGTGEEGVRGQLHVLQRMLHECQRPKPFRTEQPLHRGDVCASPRHAAQAVPRSLFRMYRIARAGFRSNAEQNAIAADEGKNVHEHVQFRTRSEASKTTTYFCGCLK